MKPYYILIAQAAKGSRWAPQFGDFDRKVVDQEKLDTKHHWHKLAVLKVANGLQATCDKAVSDYNASSNLK
jgi:hypothetical protein